MKLYKISLLLLLTSFISYGQEPAEEETENTIENQFETIYKKSGTYQVYKVVSIENYKELKKNVLDSLKASKKTINAKESLLSAEITKLEKTNTLLNETQEQLITAQNKENSISFLGIPLSKSLYNLILWGIICTLLFALLYFIFRFSRSNIITKKAENTLLDVEGEFEEHRKKSLEREQVLRRKLQDEINKQRNG